MRAKIDVSDVEAATKIRAKYLRAIENEEWDLLPGPTFVKSFLRTYAEYLGLDAKLLVDEFKLRHEVPHETELQPIGPPPGRSELRRSGAPSISRGWIAGLALAGVLALLIVIGTVGDGDSEPSGSATQTTRSAPVRRAPVAPPAPTRVALTLIPEGEVYVCLRNARNELVVNETLTPDSERRTYRSPRFHLTLGNSAVKLRINGRTVSVPNRSEEINYRLTPAGRREVGENAC